MSDDTWIRQIFEEKGLWDVYRKSQKSLPRQKVNQFVFRAFSAIAIIFVVWSVFFETDDFYITESAAFAHKIADAGFILSLSILGFLIAGFAIFSSITKTELFVLLAKIPYKRNGQETELNRFQFVFFNFLNAFTIYIALLVISLLVDVLFAESSPVNLIGDIFARKFPKAAYIANCISASLLGLLLVEAVLRLKAFIWNLYQAVLLGIATEEELKKPQNHQ